MSTTANISYILKVSSTISINLSYSGETIIDGCRLTLHDLDEEDKNAFSNEDGSYSEAGLEGIILALRYGISHAIKYGSEKGYWNDKERAELENREILRIMDIEQLFSESTTKKVIVE